MLQQETRAQQLIKLYGGNCRPKLTYSTTTDLVDILTVDREDINWIQRVRRETTKSNVCPMCGKRDTFQLDHMNPWRPYVIFMLGANEAAQSGNKLMVSKNIVRALYNDPDNLWWICTHCNSLKSDRIYTIAEVNAIRRGSAPGTPAIKGEAIRDHDTLLTLLSNV